MLKDGLEILCCLPAVYVFYRGLMGVAYELLDRFLAWLGYPDETSK